MSRALLALGALVMVGCLLPDRSLIERDGGLDSGPPDDADIDAPDHDAADGEPPDGGCRPTQQFERTCDNGDDDDCDGLVDCNDFDCGRDLACCGAGGDQVVSEFDADSLEWLSLPLGVAPAIQREPTDDVIRNFYTAEPRGLRYASCLPVDLGVRITARLRAATLPSCTSREACPYAAIVLTAVPDMAPGATLPDELSVRLYGDRQLEVRRAGRVIARPPTPYGNRDVEISIELSPGVREPSRDAWVFGRVVVTQTGAPTPVWEPFAADPDRRRALIPREHLAGEGFGCAAVRGLYVALEGRGAYVDVDAVTTDPYECANPSSFRTVSGAAITTLDGTALRAGDTWASGGIGAPALGSYFVGASDAWDVYFDATNVPRTNELSAPVRFAIGGATTADDDGLTGWSSRGALGAPVLGVSPPQCAGAGCGALSSVREPSLYLPLEEDTRRLPGSSFGWLAAARELEGSSGRRFGIDLHQIGVSAFFVAAPTPLLRPADEGGGCDSLRDPVLLPAGPHPTSTFWLLYGCERSGTLRELRMVRVDTDGTVRASLPGELVLRGEAFGAIADITLRGADAASWFPSDGDPLAVHRLWVVARDLAGRTSLAFAQSAEARDVPPRFVPYAANPVLRADDPVLGACPGRCDIDSVAVARIANAPQRVRLLVGRTITTASEVRHTLLPLDQVWPQ